MKEFWQNWDFWNPEKEPVSDNPPKKYRKISICTACMNQTDDLKKTLVQNIRDNSSYPNIEFVVLNYNSQDGMDRLMQSSNVRYLIKMGIVKYYVTKTPKVYSISHARNIAFKNAAGNIVANMNPENYTGKGFAHFLNGLADICPEKAFFTKGKSMMNGRIAMYRSEFLSIGGYDEQFTGDGFCDYDLMARAMNSGFKMMCWAGVTKEDFAKSVLSYNPNPLGDRNLLITERSNKIISMANLATGKLTANIGKEWGQVSDLTLFRA